MKNTKYFDLFARGLLWAFFLFLLPIVDAQTANPQKLTIELITPYTQPTPNQYQQNGHTLLTYTGKYPTKDDLIDAFVKGKKIGFNLDLSTANDTLHHMVRIVSFNITGVNMSHLTNQTTFWYDIGIYDPATNTTFTTKYQDNGSNGLIWYSSVWAPVVEQMNMFISPPPIRAQKILATQKIVFF